LKKGRAFRDQDGEATSRGGTQSLAFLFPQGLMVCGFVDEFMPLLSNPRALYLLLHKSGASRIWRPRDWD